MPNNEFEDETEAKKVAEELGIESIESSPAGIRRLKPTKNGKIIPTKTQLKVMGKEFGIGLKKGIRRGAFAVGKGIEKGGRYAKERIQQRLAEERELQKELSQIRREQRIQAIKERAMEEGREISRPSEKGVFGFNRTTPTPKISMGIPIFEKKTNGIPIFQQRKTEMTLMSKREKPNLMRIKPKLDILTLPKTKKLKFDKKRLRL